MPIEVQTDQNHRHCRIGGALSIWEAADTWKTLGPLLASAGPLHIDLSGIDSCDGAGIQIIWQLQQAIGADPHNIHIEGVSEALLDAIAQAGMDLPLWAVCHGKE